MKKLFIYFGIVIFFILAIGTISAINTEVYDYQGANIRQKINYSLFQANNLMGNLSWTNLTDYPVACPDGSYVTQIDDNITCTVDTQTNTSYVPYTGANQNVNLGNNNLTIDTNTLFVDSTNNRVGIGTTSPSYALTVIGAGRFTNGLYVSGGVLQSNTIKSYNSNTDLTLGTYTAGYDVLLNPSSGNVGIGTTSPQQKLHVNGNILANGTINSTVDVCIQGNNCLSGNGGLNLSSNLKVNGNLNITGNVSGSSFYTGMWFYNQTGIPFNLNTTYQIISNTNQGDSNGFLFHSNTSLELIDSLGAGEYTISWRTFGLGSQNHIYEGFVFINGVQQNNTVGMGIGQASSAVRTEGNGHIKLNKYDNITIRLADTSGTSTVTAYLGNVLVERIGN